ncbi:MAG: hypothetical protein ACRDOI_10830 [Trebonia sp.]
MWSRLPRHLEDQALAYYRGLGFTRVDRRSTAYLFVEDADALAGTWIAAGGDVRPPQDTEWGQHEGVLVDPDGNVIRFGSPMSADPGGARALDTEAPRFER